jgi:hypothetical protein
MKVPWNWSQLSADDKIAWIEAQEEKEKRVNEKKEGKNDRTKS